MTNPNTPPLPRATVVRVGTGTKHEVALAPGYLELEVCRSSCALGDADREAKADEVRTWIAALREQAGVAEQELCALYREPAAPWPTSPA